MPEPVGSLLPRARKHVVVVGAGFSKALSSKLLLSNELGQRAWGRLVAQDDPLFTRWQPTFSADYPFEALLSLLAEPQPHLREPENLENQARFAKLVEAIVSELSQAQEAALEAGVQPWLFELLGVLHARRSTVVSLNYDFLIERGVGGHYLRPTTRSWPPPPGPRFAAEGYNAMSPVVVLPSVMVDAILDGLPEPADHVDQSENTPVESFRLIKLHGSLEWWWTPKDPFAPVTRGGAGTARRRRKTLPGREPFIIPPLSLKSGYYQNPITRQLWQDAAEALAEAERVSILGYSLPSADVVVGGLLERSLRGRSVVVDVVDPEPDDVCKRIEALGGPGLGSDLFHVATCAASDTCVAPFVASLCDEASADTARALRDAGLPGSAHDLLSITYARAAQGEPRQVIAVHAEPDGTVVLRTGDEGLGHRPGGGASVADLNAALATATRLMAASSTGHRLPVVGAIPIHFDNPSAWHQLEFLVAGRLDPN